MNYQQLQTNALTLVIDTPAAVQALMPTFVNWAVKKLEDKHNFKVMEYDATFTTTFGSRIIGTRPADWKLPRGNPYYVEELGAGRELFYIPSKAEGVMKYGDNVDLDYGEPSLVYEDDANNQFILYPYPDGVSDYADGEYRLVVPYWRYLPTLVNPTDTNWFTVNAEQYLIYQAVAEAFYANEDENRAQTWEVRAAKEYKDVVFRDKQRRLGEVQSLVPHLGALMPHTQE